MNLFFSNHVTMTTSKDDSDLENALGGTRLVKLTIGVAASSPKYVIILLDSPFVSFSTHWKEWRTLLQSCIPQLFHALQHVPRPSACCSESDREPFQHCFSCDRLDNHYSCTLSAHVLMQWTRASVA